MKRKVLLIGWDAADWKIIWPLIAKGQMPALKKLIDNGVYGNMSTMNPPYSPMLWSSVATGKTPDKHGVLNFIELDPEKQRIRPVTVNARKSKALWNIFHNQGLKSNVVGWWPSFPAEPINGVVVSDRFQKLGKNMQKDNWELPDHCIHPKKLQEKLKDLRFHPKELTAAHILPFIPNLASIDFKDTEKKDYKVLNSFAKVFSENTSVHMAATRVMRTTEWDFMAVYYDFIDHLCHGFMKYRAPKLDKIPQEFHENYKEVIDGAYRYQDMMLERMMDLADENTTIIVMSDHGYESGSKRILKMPKYPAAPALEHRRFGMFVAAGPGIQKNKKIYGLGLIDVAPTILHYYGLPIGKDMDGKPLLEIFTTQKTPEYIESWEKMPGDFGVQKTLSGEEALSDQEAMEQLIELGYIDKPDEKIEKAIHKTKCDIKHNLARVYMGKKDYKSAKEILVKLIEEKDVDTIPFYMDLMTISLQENEYTNAEKYLLKLRTMDKKFKLNTTLIEAKILIYKKKYNEAIKLLEKVSEKNTRNSGILLELGNVYYKLNRFQDAIHAYEKGIKVQPDTAKFHYGMAKTLYQLKDYEEAAEYALTSIELVRYFPDAHYILGCCLEKLGDLANAKNAFETAKMLKPKLYKAEKAIENIQYAPKKSNGHEPMIFPEEDIVIVSGLPRSGTSLMMQMLTAGGIEPLVDSKRKPDESNPKGYYEYAPVKSLNRDNSWLHKAEKKSLKVVSPLLKFLDSKYRYKILFMKRDLAEIVTSQQVMLRKDTKTLPVRLFNAYERELENVAQWQENQPGVAVLHVDYKDLIYDSHQQISAVRKFLNKDLDEEKMKACIDKNLYRNRIS